MAETIHKALTDLCGAAENAQPAISAINLIYDIVAADGIQRIARALQGLNLFKNMPGTIPPSLDLAIVDFARLLMSLLSSLASICSTADGAKYF